MKHHAFFSRIGLLGALSLTACASNPYIERTRPVQDLKQGSIDYALAYADATYDAYEAKLSEDYRRQQALSSGLLGVGAAVLGAGIGSVHKDVIVGLSLGGGLAYQLGTWNNNQGRLGIYLEGMKALSCAKMAVAPLRLRNDALLVIRQARMETTAAVDGAATAAALTTQGLASGGDAELLQAARTELTELKSQLDQTNELLGRAAGMAQRVDGAGAMLETKVDQIRSQINAALNSTLAQLSALPQLIGSISSYANVFAPGLKFDASFADRIGKINPKTPAGNAAAEANRNGVPANAAALPDLAAALGQLRAARIRLAGSAAQLAGATDRPVVQAVEDLKGCGVDASKISSALSLDRSTLSFTVGEPGTTNVSVSGGTTPYTASLQDAPAKGLSILSAAGGTVLTVVADNGTVAGKLYKVKVEDSAHNSALLTIQIKAKTDGGDATPESEVASCTGLDKVGPAEACLIQSLLGVSADGKVGDKTCTAFKTHVPSADGLSATARLALAKRRGLTAWPTQAADFKPLLSAAEISGCKLDGSTPPTVKSAANPAISAAVPASITDARNDLEKKISGDQIFQLGRALGLAAPDRALGKSLRDALASYQKDKLRNADGSLDALSVKELLDKAVRIP